MPNGQQRRLDQLMADGLEVYPADMRGMGAAPRALSISQSTIAGMGQDTGRPTFITGRRSPQEVVLKARQGAWGVGRSTRRRPSKAERARNEQRFVQWLRKTQPRLYALAKQRIGEPPTGLGALGQEATTTTNGGTWFSNLTDTLSTLATTYLPYKQQKDLLDVQLERARQGLPPLDTSQYATAVQVGLDPEQTRAALQQAGGAAVDFMTQPMVLMAGAGLLLLVMMRR